MSSESTPPPPHLVSFVLGKYLECVSASEDDINICSGPGALAPQSSILITTYASAPTNLESLFFSLFNEKRNAIREIRSVPFGVLITN